MLHAPLRRLRFVSCGMDVRNFKTSQDLPSPQLMNCYFLKIFFFFKFILILLILISTVKMPIVALAEILQHMYLVARTPVPLS